LAKYNITNVKMKVIFCGFQSPEFFGKKGMKNGHIPILGSIR
jgi:hypothetical protein